MDVKVGCCGFPGGRARYCREFPLVEVQHSFYRLPRLETVERWRDGAPEGFEFVLKAPQTITHPPSSPTYRRSGLRITPRAARLYGLFRPSREVEGARRATEALARTLGCRVILYQCPPGFGPAPENLRNLRRFFGAPSPFRCAWEFRGEGWTRERVEHLCGELNLIPVVDPLVHEPPVAGDTAYFRLHGRPAYRYSYRYSDRDLRELKERLEGLDVKTCYVLFNNASMEADAKRFMAMVERG